MGGKEALGWEGDERAKTGAEAMGKERLFGGESGRLHTDAPCITVH